MHLVIAYFSLECCTKLVYVVFGVSDRQPNKNVAAEKALQLYAS